MFANAFQSGFISIFYSVGSNPLSLWDKQVKNGHIRRVIDDEVKSLVLEVSGTNVATTYITSPIKPRASLGVKLPFLVMIIKNMKKYFTFEIQILDELLREFLPAVPLKLGLRQSCILRPDYEYGPKYSESDPDVMMLYLDDKDMHRRFRISNFQSTTKVRPFCTTMPIGLSSGWNQVQFNLADFTKRAYGSTYLETTRVQIHANVRIRRIYFSDVLYSDEDLPNEFKLFLPGPGSHAKPRRASKQEELEQKKDSKKLSAEELRIQAKEEEIPPGAPPTPAEPAPPEESPKTPVLESPIEVEVSPVETATDVSGEGGEIAVMEGGEEAKGEVAGEPGETAPGEEGGFEGGEASPGDGGGEAFIDASEAPPEEAAGLEALAEAPAEGEGAESAPANEAPPGEVAVLAEEVAPEEAAAAE